MKTHSLTQNGCFLKRLGFLSNHRSGTSTPLQGDPFNQGNLSFTQYTKKQQNIQQVYYLERRCFF